jgi:protein tyrosine/serine phosphatase
MVAEHLYQIKFNYNFGTITDGKVYKSGVIPPDRIADYIKEHNIKAVIDFRHGQIQDELNPANLDEIALERNAVNAIPNVNYFNIPSSQVPVQDNLDKLYAVLDEPENYPVLMHCYHGTGRAMIYSAIYKMEYEDMPNEEARQLTRPFYSLPFSSFRPSKPKGKFVLDYKKRPTN